MTQEQINVDLFNEVKKLQSDRDKWRGIAERLAGVLVESDHHIKGITEALAAFEEAKK
jgi:hypothetical protein